MEFKIYLKKLRDLDHSRKKNSLVVADHDFHVNFEARKSPQVKQQFDESNLKILPGPNQDPKLNAANNDSDSWRRESISDTHIQRDLKLRRGSGFQDSQSGFQDSHSASDSLTAHQRKKSTNEVTFPNQNQYFGRGQNYNYWKAAETLFASNGVIRGRRRSSYVFIVSKAGCEDNVHGSAEYFSEKGIRVPGQTTSDFSSQLDQPVDPGNVLEQASDFEDQPFADITKDQTTADDSESNHLPAMSADDVSDLEVSRPSEVSPEGGRAGGRDELPDRAAAEAREDTLRRKLEAGQRQSAKAERHRSRMLAGQPPPPPAP